MIVAMCFFADDSNYANVRSRNEERLLVYWKCMCVTYHSLARWGGISGRRIIFSNVSPPPDILRILHRYNVEILNIPFTSRPPEGYSDSWAGSLYLLDAIEWAAINITDEGVLFIDPDCVVANDLSRVEQALSRADVIAYDLRIDFDLSVNGCSRKDISNFIRDVCNRPIPDFPLPKMFGGEFLALSPAGARSLSARVNEIWSRAVTSAAQEVKLTTEEHVLSAALHLFPLEVIDAGDGLVRRMWTTGHHRSHGVNDERLCIWHLPAEKERGFSKVYNLIKSGGGDDTEFSRDVISRYLHLREDRGRQLWYVLTKSINSISATLRGRAVSFNDGI